MNHVETVLRSEISKLRDENADLRRLNFDLTRHNEQLREAVAALLGSASVNSADSPQ